MQKKIKKRSDEMEITAQEFASTTFESIEQGNPFEYDGHYYIKIEPITGSETDSDQIEDETMIIEENGEDDPNLTPEEGEEEGDIAADPTVEVLANAIDLETGATKFENGSGIVFSSGTVVFELSHHLSLNRLLVIEESTEDNTEEGTEEE